MTGNQVPQCFPTILNAKWQELGFDEFWIYCRKVYRNPVIFGTKSEPIGNARKPKVFILFAWFKQEECMGVCDICNAPLPVDAKLVSAADIRKAATAGYRPPSHAMLQAGVLAGLSSENAEAAWLQQVQQDSTDWALCAACALDINSFLGASTQTAPAVPQAAPPGQAKLASQPTPASVPPTASAETKPPAPSDDRIACPACGHLTPKWRSECEQCRANLSSGQRSVQGERPGCLSAYAILQGIAGVILFIAAIVSNSENAFGGSDAWILLFLFALGGVQIALAWGLWGLKKWARTLTMVLIGINVAVSFISIFTGNIFGIVSGFIGLAILNWFQKNGEYFS
ncbi:MAG: hypothetical protein AB1894_23050 [Chloroflexota bacterium]